MDLTPEQRRRIYEEEKTRIEAQGRLQHERSAPLDAEIDRYLAVGYRVVSRTATEAQLVRPKQFGCLLPAALAVFTLGILFVVYVIYYMAQKDELVYLRLVDGEVEVTEPTWWNR